MHIITLVSDRTRLSLDQCLLREAADLLQAPRWTLLSDAEAAEFHLPEPPNQPDLQTFIADRPIDAIVTESAGPRRKRLLLADMDSTIVTSETLDELAAFAGLKDQISEITIRAMNGELDFKQALRHRVRLLKGLSLNALEQTWKGIELTKGAITLVQTMKGHDAYTALVSGGFTYFTARVAAACGFHISYANTLLDDGQSLTGEVADPILDKDSKLAALRTLSATHQIPLSATLATGDGANDLPMLESAGLGVAFHAKPFVAARARAQIRHTDLRTLLFAQGYRAEDFTCV